MPRRPDPVETGLQAVHALREAPRDGALLEGLRRALGHPSSYVVAASATVAGERELSELQPALLAAWERLYDAKKGDPGCKGKTALALALDRLESRDADAFRRGAAWVQMEPVWGGSVDVAGELRGRCVFALARIGVPDALVVLADALTDPVVTVRSAAGQALAVLGDPGTVGLAVLKLRVGDAEPAVLADVLGSLLVVDADEGLKRARRLIADGEPEIREQLTLAVGQSRVPAAFGLLSELWETAALPEDRRVLIVAMGLVRTEPSRALLLDLVRTGSIREARWAVAALGTHSQSPAMREAVEAAASGRDLAEAIALAFAL